MHTPQKYLYLSCTELSCRWISITILSAPPTCTKTRCAPLPHKHLNTHAHPSDLRFSPPPPPLAGAELGGRVRGRGRGAGAHAQQQASRQQRRPRCARTCDAWQPRCDARAGSSDCAINRADTQNVLGTTVFLHTDLIVSHNNWELKWG